MAEAKLGEQNRLHFLDAIRGLAALAVVFQHILWYVSPAFENFFSTFWSPGRFGVVAFFLVSGFIVPHSLEAKKDVKAFWTSRFFRLFPTYWFSLFLILIVQITGLVWHPDYNLKYLATWAVNLTMLQGFVKMPDINPVAWTLGVELVLYIGITFAFMKGILKRTELISGILLGLVACASIVLPYVFHIRFPAGAAAVCSAIVFGLVLFRQYTNDLGRTKTMWIGLACLTVLVLSSLVNYSPVRLPVDPSQAEQLQPTQLCAILSAVTGCAFFLFLYWQRNLKFPLWILWLGKVSYSLYLFHSLVGQVLPKDGNSILRAAIELPLSLLFGWLGYTIIESPTMRYASRVLKSKRNLSS